MRHFFTVSAFLLGLVGLSASVLMAQGQSVSYSISPDENSQMELLVYKTGIYSGKIHTFLFHEFTGELDYDPQHPEASRIQFIVKTASLELTDDWLDSGDREDVIKEAEEKVLEIAKYPEMRFVSTAIRAIGGNRYEVDGMLKIRNREEPSTVTVSLQPGADGSLRFQGDAVVTLTDYGIDPPRVFFGIVGTKDDMDFRFSVTATPIP